MSIPKDQQRALLVRLAREAMVARGLLPDFTPKALAGVRPNVWA